MNNRYITKCYIIICVVICSKRWYVSFWNRSWWRRYLSESTRESFFDELETRDKVSAAISALPEQYAYIVFDDALASRAKQIDFYKSKGVVVEGKTIEELAKKIKVPADTLKQTLDSWNQDVANKKDPEFGRSTAMDYDLTKAPYYGIQIAPGIHHTMSVWRLTRTPK